MSGRHNALAAEMFGLTGNFTAEDCGRKSPALCPVLMENRCACLAAIRAGQRPLLQSLGHRCPCEVEGSGMQESTRPEDSGRVLYHTIRSNDLSLLGDNPVEERRIRTNGIGHAQRSFDPGNTGHPVRPTGRNDQV